MKRASVIPNWSHPHYEHRKCSSVKFPTAQSASMISIFSIERPGRKMELRFCSCTASRSCRSYPLHGVDILHRAAPVQRAARCGASISQGRRQRETIRGFHEPRAGAQTVSQYVPRPPSELAEANHIFTELPMLHVAAARSSMPGSIGEL
jgi:hypothetical protein